ncbi:MAG: DUF1330 domain-containing protein [Alphaproteobacteria bacterium]
MPAYAVGHLTQVDMGPDIVRYLEGIDESLEPFGGRFRIHGGPVERLEGTWSGDLIVIEFPDMQRARDWYSSDAYQAILPLRTNNSEGQVFLIEGVGDDHRAPDVLARAR